MANVIYSDILHYYYSIYARDGEIRLRWPKLARRRGVGGRRGPIRGWTRGSIRRLRRVLSNSGVQFRTFVHLTYPAEFPRDGLIVKRHLKAFLEALRRLGMRNYVWILEFQERGAPHVHLLVDIGKEEGLNKDWVATTWARIASADPRAGTRVESVYSNEAISYLLNYLSQVKQYQKTVPQEFVNVGRLWGASRGLGKALECGFLDFKTGSKVARVVRAILRRRGVRFLRNYGGGVIFGGADIMRRLLVWVGEGA